MIQERAYREKMGSGRFASFRIVRKESDLWIGVDPASYTPEMEEWADARLRDLRADLEAYGAARPEFLSSLVPIGEDPAAPSIAGGMLAAARMAGVGPMAAVAGAVAASIGAGLAERYGAAEVAVENGGDDWLLFREEIAIAVSAGASPLSGKIGIRIPARHSPIGVCTSSGTVGPSLSFGKADAVMVVCRDATLADAWATAIGNAVTDKADIEPALAKTSAAEEILAALIVKGEAFGIRGAFPLAMFR